MPLTLLECRLNLLCLLRVWWEEHTHTRVCPALLTRTFASTQDVFSQEVQREHALNPQGPASIRLEPSFSRS